MAQTPEPETGKCERIIRVVDEEQSLAYHCDGRPGEFRAIPPKSRAEESRRFSTGSPGVAGLCAALGSQALGDATAGTASAAAARDARALVANSITLSRFDSQALLRLSPVAAAAVGSGVARSPVETGGYQERLEQTVGDLAAL
jgi:hypothetical protein